MSNDDMRDDSFDESLKKILEIASSGVPEKQSEKSNKKSENLHEGHRQRVYEAASKDMLLDTFSEVEALEYVLFAALPRIDTNEIAHRLLIAFGSLSGVFEANITELAAIPGMSERVAYFLRAIPAIARKAHLTRTKPETIKTIDDALEYLRRYFEFMYTEAMFVLSLDATDRVLGVDCVTARGTATGNVVSVPAIMESVCHHHASKVIIAHNHPGGIMMPSNADISLTDMLIDSLAALDIVIVDHMILTPENCYLSFFNSGLILEMYSNYDRAHRGDLSKLLPKDTHHLNSGKEYIFDIQSASVMPKREYDKLMAERRAARIQRTRILSEIGIENRTKGKKSKK